MRWPILIALTACTSAPDMRSGYVMLASGEGSYAEARFFTTEFPEIVSTSTPCELDRYNSAAFPDGNFDAGVITVSGTSPPITLTPVKSGEFAPYNFYSATRALFSGGEALTITASGDDVPAFTEQLVAPSMIVVTSPSGNGSLDIPIHQDLVISWTGGTGLAQFTLGSVASGDIAVCRFPAGDGTGVVPHAVLEDMWQHGDGQFSFDSVDFVHVSLGDWRVDVSATFPGMWANGGTATGYANLLR